MPLRQSPHYPSHLMSVHLPASQKPFFLGESDGNVEVRAQWYHDLDELARTRLDTVFYTRPAYT